MEDFKKTAVAFKKAGDVKEGLAALKRAKTSEREIERLLAQKGRIL